MNPSARELFAAGRTIAALFVDSQSCGFGRFRQRQ
jgi:hypothetical protein